MAGRKYANDVVMVAAGTLAYLVLIVRPIDMGRGAEMFFVTVIYALLVAALCKVRALSSKKAKRDDGSNNGSDNDEQHYSNASTLSRRLSSNDSLFELQGDTNTIGQIGNCDTSDFVAEEHRQSPNDLKVLIGTENAEQKKKRSVAFEEKPCIIPMPEEGYLTTPIHKIAATNPMNTPAEIEEARKIIHKHLNLVNSQDFKGRTPLHVAVENNFLNFCKYLLLKGAELSIRDVDGNTPIHTAAAFGDAGIDVSSLLLSVSPKSLVNLRNNAQETPLHVALNSGNECALTLQKLVDYGADITLKDRNGNLPVQVAVERGSQKVVSVMLKCVPKSHIKVRDGNGNTLLHVVAMRRDSDESLAKVVCTYSKAARCDFLAKNNNGRTAAEEAKVAGNDAVATVISSYERFSTK